VALALAKDARTGHPQWVLAQSLHHEEVAQKAMGGADVDFAVLADAAVAERDNIAAGAVMKRRRSGLLLK